MIRKEIHIFKKLLVISTLVGVGLTSSQAQKAKVTSANSYLSYGEIGKAKEAIDLAKEHEKSKGLARTWMIRGKVYHAIFDSKDPAIKSLEADALSIAYVSYTNALQLDEKGRYKDDIKKMLEICALQFINQGVADYASGKFAIALNGFENSIAINKMPEFNKIDTLSIYNAALTAEKMGDYEKASAYYNELAGYHYGGAKIYYFLLNIMKKQGVEEGKIELIQKARNTYPDDDNLILEELNYYIGAGNQQKAINNLIAAIGNDANNYNLYYTLGAIYEETGDFDNSKQSYEMALQLVRPDYKEKLAQFKEGNGETLLKETIDRIHELHFNILYNYGALYFNQGAKQEGIANNIKDNTKYKVELKEAYRIKVLALPYLQEALKFKANDRNTMQSLKNLYSITGDKEKADQLQQLLEN